MLDTTFNGQDLDETSIQCLTLHYTFVAGLGIWMTLGNASWEYSAPQRRPWWAYSIIYRCDQLNFFCPFNSRETRDPAVIAVDFPSRRGKSCGYQFFNGHWNVLVHLPLSTLKRCFSLKFNRWISAVRLWSANILGNFWEWPVHFTNLPPCWSVLRLMQMLVLQWFFYQCADCVLA